MFRYEAVIEEHTPNGYYVYYDGWGNKEEVLSLYFTYGYLVLTIWLSGSLIGVANPNCSQKLLDCYR